SFSKMKQTKLIKRQISYLVVLGLVLTADGILYGGGTVTGCNEASLDAALVGGGTGTFTCDGTIIITTTKNIARDTILDGAGHTVTISGNSAVRLFSVNAAVNFSVYNLTLANGKATNGGAMYSSGTLVASNCIFSGNSVNNSASGSGGAIYNN